MDIKATIKNGKLRNTPVGHFVVVGESYGHPDFHDGTTIYTTPVFRRYKNLVKTQNSLYNVAWMEEIQEKRHEG